MKTPAYAKQLDLHTYKTNIKTQKIEGSLLKIYKIAIALLKVMDELSRSYFF